MATDPVQTFPLNPVPLGVVDPNPETVYHGPTGPNNGVKFPGGVEALASVRPSDQKVGPAPMQTDNGYVLGPATGDFDAQRTRATPGADATRERGGEGGGQSSVYIPGTAGGAQGGAQSQGAPGTTVTPGMSSQQRGTEVLEQPPAAGAGQAPSNAAQGGTNVPGGYQPPASDPDPEVPKGTGLELPDAPTSPVVTQGAADMTAHVTFVAPANTGSRPITGYKVYNGATVVGTGAASPIITSALTAGAKTLAVSAVTAVGEGAKVTAAPFTIVTKP